MGQNINSIVSGLADNAGFGAKAPSSFGESFAVVARRGDATRTAPICPDEENMGDDSVHFKVLMSLGSGGGDGHDGYGELVVHQRSSSLAGGWDAVTAVRPSAGRALVVDCGSDAGRQVGVRVMPPSIKHGKSSVFLSTAVLAS